MSAARRAGPDSETAEVPAHVLTASGHRLYLDPEDRRAQELLRLGSGLSDASMRLWRAVLGLRAWDVVVDVGANYGEMLLGVDAGRRRVCFEPSPTVLPYLRRSVDESGVEVDLREVAVGARSGTASFVVDTVWSGRSGLARTHRTDADHPLDEVEVPVRTLDEELQLAAGESVCVKIDVEGAEFDVLAGARGVLGGDRPWAVMLEILHMDAFEKARLARQFTMRLMDRRTGELVKVPPASPQRVAELAAAGWLHPQDAVLTAKEA